MGLPCLVAMLAAVGFAGISAAEKSPLGVKIAACLD